MYRKASITVLWNLGAVVRNYDITQQHTKFGLSDLSFSVDGKQYIAISAGLGGGSPRIVPSILTPEIKYPDKGNALYVFRLPD